MSAPELVARALLVEDGLLELREGRHRTTRRWQAAMARAAFRLLSVQGDGVDLRVPIAEALLELYGNSVSDEELATLVAAMLPVELGELRPGDGERFAAILPAAR